MSEASARSRDDGTWVIHNDVISVTINPERGADILSVIWSATDEEIMWRNPRATLAPRRGEIDMDASSYFDNYPGGMQELFPNAGAPTTVHGAPLPFHGEALRRPWTVSVESRSDGVEVTCETVLTRYPFRMTKVFRLDDASSVLHFSSTVENLSTVKLPAHWGLHPAFNTSGVAASGTVYGPFAQVAAHPEVFGERQHHEPATVFDALDVADGVGGFALAPGDGATADLLYATVASGWFGLRSPATDLLVTMTWPGDLFPELWIWQECHAPGGYPWFGTEHIVAIEPHTTSPFGPLAEEAETPDVLWIDGEASRTAHFTLGIQPIAPDQIPSSIVDGVARLAPTR